MARVTEDLGVPKLSRALLGHMCKMSNWSNTEDCCRADVCGICRFCQFWLCPGQLMGNMR